MPLHITIGCEKNIIMKRFLRGVFVFLRGGGDYDPPPSDQCSVFTESPCSDICVAFIFCLVYYVLKVTQKNIKGVLYDEQEVSSHVKRRCC